MEWISRNYSNEEDLWRIRTFLRDVLLLNSRTQRSWDVMRFDYWVAHVNRNIFKMPLEETIFLWETKQGEIMGVLQADSPGEVFLHLHPRHQSPELETDMIATAEANLAGPGSEGGRQLYVWTLQEHVWRQNYLQQRGYVRSGSPEYMRRRRMDLPLPEVKPAAGYQIHAMRDGLELVERCYASGLGFHPDDIMYAVNNRKDVTWYHNIQKAPLYRQDLDLVAVDEEGRVASFCTAWFDDYTRTAIFEPVATVPDHQRRGLGRALLAEGLRRLKELGTLVAFVGSYSASAGALYEAAGFTDFLLCEPWLKKF